MNTGATVVDWAVFAVVVAATMLLDVAIFGRAKRHMSFREAAMRSLLFITVGVSFSAFVLARMRYELAASYLTAYIVEESLSVDNLFVFLVIFNHFGLNEKRQQRVLFWGVLGAVVMRGVFVFTGAAILQRFHAMTYVFGAFLVFVGVRLALRKEESVDPEQSVAIRLARRLIRTTDEYDGEHFMTVRDGVRLATPLLLVLIVIELSDLMFAVDSVPAVLAISSDVYVVYTSNIMAILGLRALYFVLSGMMNRFHYLGLGLSLILVFIGSKMALSSLVTISSTLSLGIIGAILTAAVLFSLARPAGSAE